MQCLDCTADVVNEYCKKSNGRTPCKKCIICGPILSELSNTNDVKCKPFLSYKNTGIPVHCIGCKSSLAVQPLPFSLVTTEDQSHCMDEAICTLLRHPLFDNVGIR